MTAGVGAVTADRDDQRRGPPSVWLMSQAPDGGVARDAFTATAATPSSIRAVRLDHATGQHRTVGFESLAGDLESEFIESAEGSQISAGEAGADGSGGHVEVFGWAA